MQSRATEENKRAVCSLYLSQIINSEWGHVSINICQQDHSERGSIYCVIKCTVWGNQACVKNAGLRHHSCTVVMYRHKSVSPIHNVLIHVVIWSWYKGSVSHTHLCHVAVWETFLLTYKELYCVPRWSFWHAKYGSAVPWTVLSHYMCVTLFCHTSL